MAIVSSIRHSDITNDYNDGANSLKQFLQYAEALSNGDATTARRVLENLNPLARKALGPLTRSDAVIESLAEALRSRGHTVDLNVGQSRFRCDLAVKSESGNFYQLGILVDTEGHYANPNLLDRYLMQPSILRAFGWRVAVVLTKDWYHNPDDVLSRIEKLLQGTGTSDEPEAEDDEEAAPVAAPAISPSAPATTRTSRGPRRQPEGGSEQQGARSGIPVRRFELVSGSSKKFWEISVENNSFTVRFGRIGTAGQSQTKSFAETSKARMESEKLIAEKLKKGYIEKT
jgi:predicted DNA-binding WGR domain protein